VCIADSSPIFVDMDTAAIILSLAAPPSELMTKTHNEMYILNFQLICCTQSSWCALLRNGFIVVSTSYLQSMTIGKRRRPYHGHELLP